MTHLYLIRHAEAQGAVQRRVLESGAQAGLTARGVHQAECLRDRLAATGEIAADVLIASTYTRARETAEIIAPALGLPVTLDEEVQELRVGEAEGLLYTEFYARFGEPDFDHNPFRPVAPGGESWAEFKVRVAAALHRITQQDYAGKTVCIVCHGGFIDGAFLYFFGLSSLARPAADFFTHNASITEWKLHERRGARRWRLVRYNDDLHLRDNVHWQGVSPEGETGADALSLPLPTESRDDT